MAEESIAGLYGETPARPDDRASIAAEAEEGLLLAEYATRMRLKNRIEVDALTGAGHLDLDDWVDEARLSLGGLRIEAEASAKRMADERALAARSRGAARHEHDYRHRDTANLDRRRRVYTALATLLLRFENDDERVRELIAAAREDATAEMRSAMSRLLPREAAAPADRALLEERLRLVAAVDLPALAAERSRLGETDLDAVPAPAPPPPPGLLDRLRRRR